MNIETLAKLLEKMDFIIHSIQCTTLYILMVLNLQKSKTFFNVAIHKGTFYPIINALFEKQIIIICL